MRILFCDDGYTEARRQLAPLLPNAEILAVAARLVRESLGGVDVIVPYGARIDADVINSGSFGLVQQFGVGLETVEVDAATAAGVWVARIPAAQTGNAEATAEHALFLMLALARRFSAAQAALQNHVLGEPAGVALFDKTACIVGLGAVGSALGAALHGLGMRVVALRRFPDRTVTGFLPDAVFGYDAKSKALGGADFVIICARYSADSHHLVDANFISAMKPSSFLVNVARGKLVDPQALTDGLASARIAGAGLDVFWEEPVDLGHPLFTHNVIATPHVAGVTDASYRGIARAFADNVTRWARGVPPQFAVNSPPRPRHARM